MSGVSAVVAVAHYASHGYIAVENAAWNAVSEKWRSFVVASAEAEGMVLPKVPRAKLEQLIIYRSNVEGISATWALATSTIESTFNSHAISEVGAVGVMQVMPNNAGHCGIKPEDLLDAEKNIICGCKMLREALNAGGSMKMGSRYYHGGPRALKTPKKISIDYADAVMAKKDTLDKQLKNG